VSWRQDGRSIARDGQFVARFVAYIEANTVRERLDTVVPGEWDLTLELLPSLPARDDTEGAVCSFKARLQILGVIREDVGTGYDYKTAATDAFKRAAVRFGIAHELYDLEQNWVRVDGEGRHAKPLEDPAAAYARRYGSRDAAAAGTKSGTDAEPREGDAVVKPKGRRVAASGRETATAAPAEAAPAAALPTRLAEAAVECPVCGGAMWDNRATKRNPRAPDYRCRDRSCDGVIWPSRTPAGDEATAAGGDPGSVAGTTSGATNGDAPARARADDLPF
jgi:hypothetical protein